MVRTQFGRLVCNILAVIAIACGTARSAPPDVKFLFPPGVQRGQTRTVKTGGKPGTAPIHVWSDRADVTVVPNEAGDELTVTADADAPPGLCWVRLYNEEGASPLLPLIVGVLPEVTEDEVEESTKDNPLPLPVTISGVLSRSGQVDSSSVPLQAGETLIASVESNRALGSPADIVLQLASESGFVIKQNDDHHGRDPLIVHTASQAGTCTIRLFAFPADPNSTIRFAGGDAYVYRLTLTTGPFISHVIPLSVPADSAAITAPPSQLGWNLPEDAAPPQITDASQPIPVMTSFPGSFLPRRIRRSPDPVVVEPQDLPGDAPRNLSIPVSVTGRIAAPGEIDAYTFAAGAGRKLRIGVAARSFDSLLDPLLRIVDASGKVIREDDDISRENVDASLTLTTPSGGPFRAEVTDRYGHGGGEYVYELSIVDDEPRFELTVADDRFTLSAEKSLEIPVMIDRQGGFEESIELRLEGMPEGVTAPPVTSQPKGKSAKEIKLTLSSTVAAGWRGPLEIVAARADRPPVRATTPTPSAGLTTTAIWLTVKPHTAAAGPP